MKEKNKQTGKLNHIVILKIKNEKEREEGKKQGGSENRKEERKKKGKRKKEKGKKEKKISVGNLNLNEAKTGQNC